MKAIPRQDKYLNVLVVIMLYNMVLILESVDKTLVCDHLNES